MTDIEKFQRMKKALEFRAQGLSYDGIADECGFANAKAAKDAVWKCMEETLRDTADQTRKMEGRRLDSLMMPFWKKATADADKAAALVCLRIMERRAKLFGLDAPQKMEHAGADGGPIQFADMTEDQKRERAQSILDRLGLGRN